MLLAHVTQAGDVTATGVLRILYYEMIPRKELLREMDLGPFKHKVDDGLDLRKAAFACMDGILERADDCVAPTAFLPRLRDGLTDHDDVQVRCWLLRARVRHSACSSHAAVPVVGRCNATNC